ncbi:MAG: sigma-70 family RNA polymerase sigma factor, partial [Archangium sp.]
MMKEPPELAVIFLEHVSVGVAVPDDAAEFEGLLRRAWEAGREPWPQVALPADIFVRHLAQRLPEDSEGRPLALVLEQFALPDLYLVCACVHKVPAAIETLERHHLARLSTLLVKATNLPATMLDDVCQLVRIQLLLGTSESGPELARYEGRGTLLKWIWVIAARRAVKAGASSRETPQENILEIVDAIPAPGPDVELDFIKRRYRSEFRQAVCEAFAALDSEQRHLLRLHFIDRLSTTEMSKLYRVNQSTISRWLKNARQEVYEETKSRFQMRLGLSSQEFASLLAVID